MADTGQTGGGGAVFAHDGDGLLDLVTVVGGDLVEPAADPVDQPADVD